MNFTLPDGTHIECRYAGSGGPEFKGGQQTGGCYAWYRINGTVWVPSEHRTMHRLVEWIGLCENFADFMEGEKRA